MTATAVITRSTTVLGKSHQGNKSFPVEFAPIFDVPVPAGKAGTLSARVDNDTGTATLGTGHGFLTGVLADVYWAGGSRRRMTVGVVAGNSVPLDGGVGDNLPAAATAIVMSLLDVNVASIDLISSIITMKSIFIKTEARADVVIGNAALTYFVFKFPGAGVYSWDYLSGIAIPISGVIDRVYMSNGDSTKTNNISVGFGMDTLSSF